MRDCMLHLSFAHGLAALENVGRMNATWVMMSTYADVEANRDIASGRYRAIDMTLAPYSLPPPIRSIDENNPKKQLVLWQISDVAARS